MNRENKKERVIMDKNHSRKKEEGVNIKRRMSKENRKERLIMDKNITVKFSILSLFLILIMITLVPQATAQYTKTNFYSPLGGVGSFTGGFFGQTAGQFDRSMCEAGQDFVLQIAPFGCSPAVVRSDLLEEQNVPIYCQIAATQINPLVDVKAIDYMTFSGQTPPEVAGVGFHPNKAALGTGRDTTLDNYPVLDNIGYAVIVLKRQPNESALTNCMDSKLLGLDVGEVCVVEGNLTAKIRYNIENAFGVGQASYYLPLINENEFEDRYKAYGFWDGRGFLKAESIGVDSASISIYAGRTNAGGNLQRLNNVQLQQGATSDKLYMTGFNYCLANLRLRLDKIDYPDTRAKIRVNADVYEVADEEEFLDGKCRVLGIEKYGINEEVEIRCREDTNAGLFGSGAFTLKMAPKINLQINGQAGSYGLGDLLYTTAKGGVYIGYIGMARDSLNEKDIQIYLVETRTIDKKLSDEKINQISSYIGGRFEGMKNSVPTRGIVLDLLIKAVDVVAGGIGEAAETAYELATGDTLEFLHYGVAETFVGNQVAITGFAGAVNTELKGQTQEYYQKALDDYDEVLNSFASENYNNVELGKEAFKKKIDFVYLMQQRKTVVELCKEFTQAYPNEAGLSICSSALQLANDAGSVRHVTINGKVKEISFEGVYKPGYKEYSIEGTAVNKKTGEVLPFSLRRNEIKYLNSQTAEFVQLSEIKDESTISLTLRTIPQGAVETIQGAVSSRTISFKQGVTQAGLGNYEITISKINLQRVAKVTVLPNIDYAGTETTFKFKVGIEKRSSLLKLSPEQAREKINSLDADIKRWEGISSDLGNVVTGLKTACLATGALFTVDNLLSNLDGKGIARQKVMRNSGGWYERCTALKNQGEFSSVQECLFEKSDEIDADVERYAEVQTAQDEEFKEIRNVVNNGGLFSEDVVNSTALIQDYSVRVRNALDSCAGVSFENPSKAGETVSIVNIKTALSFETWTQRRNYNFEELRDIGFYCRVAKENPDDKSAKQRLYSLLYGVDQDYKAALQTGLIANAPNLPEGMNGITLRSYGLKDSIQGTYDGKVTGETGLLGAIPKKEPVQGVVVGGVVYYFVLKQISGNDYRIIQVHDENGMRIDGEEGAKIAKQQFSKFVKEDDSSYNYEWKTPVVRYYETAPFKGAPALVPVEPKQGWYAGLKQTLPVGGNIRSFDESGKVYSYYLCNVGGNGEANFFETGFGDDKCQMIVTGSEVTFTNFNALSKQRIKDLIDKAKFAIADAQRGYSAGAQNVNVRGVSYEVDVPAVNVPQIECEDIMSPQQCRILFNVCDPVICPSSRCDLGGAYPVADVVQTGVVGSIALCLPNIEEGIVLPVCLTGVKAGIDNWASIQKSYKSCLEEQLETGKTVGICDEIQSIYACEFFWRQSVPLAKIIVPTVISTVLGQNVRGGGEYLGVADAFNRAEKSVEYFTQIYGEASFKAFKARSTDEIGGEVCKSFVSGVYPSGGNFLDTLTAPDSPPQFTGRFDEIPFTTATNPPVSHYKVFYHIFAGKDSGAYYRVYLRGVAGSSYYQDVNVDRVVDYGYIPKGEQDSETVDFTAPSGYTKLCILVNGQEECGFKQVSTDFTVNYIQDEFAKSQAETPVTSETECISGTPSLYGLINPNLQEGIGDVINPELYNRGIYRICATDNPGTSTSPTRWADVGYCGDTELRCWLDMQSVKDVIKNSNIEDDTVENINAKIQADLEAKGDAPNFEETLTKIKNTLSDTDKVRIITDVIGKFVFNKQKGWLLILRGDTYGNLARGLFKEMNDRNTANLCIKSASGATLKVNDIIPTFKTGDDLNAWCSQNGGSAVCDGVAGAFTGLKNSAMFACPVTQPVSTTTPPSTSLLPIEVRVVLGNWMGDIGVGDYVYNWDGTKWSGGVNSQGLRIEEDQSNTEWEPGLTYINSRVFTLERNFNSFIRVELSCGDKEETIVTKTELFSENVVSASIRQKALELCGYSASGSTSGGGTLTDRNDVSYNYNQNIDLVAMINYMTLASQKSYVGRTCNCGADCASYAKLILESSKNRGISDPLLLLSIMMQESNCQWDAEYGSSYGLMQINTWQDCQPALGLASINDVRGRGNINKNIDCGAIILKKKYDQYNEGVTFQGCTQRNVRYYDWEAAARGYNGVGCLSSFPEQDNYVEEVFERFKLLKGETISTSASSTSSLSISFTHNPNVGTEIVDEQLTKQNENLLSQLLLKSYTYPRIKNFNYKVNIVFGDASPSVAVTVGNQNGKESEIILNTGLVTNEPSIQMSQNDYIQMLLSHELVHTYFIYKYGQLSGTNEREAVATAVSLIEFIQLNRNQNNNIFYIKSLDTFINLMEDINPNSMADILAKQSSGNIEQITESDVKSAISKVLPQEDYNVLFG